MFHEVKGFLRIGAFSVLPVPDTEWVLNKCLLNEWVKQRSNEYTVVLGQWLSTEGICPPGAFGNV